MFGTTLTSHPPYSSPASNKTSPIISPSENALTPKTTPSSTTTVVTTSSTINHHVGTPTTASTASATKNNINEIRLRYLDKLQAEVANQKQQQEQRQSQPQPRRHHRVSFSVRGLFNSPFVRNDVVKNKDKKVSWEGVMTGNEKGNQKKMTRCKRYSSTPRRVSVAEKDRSFNVEMMKPRRLFDENNNIGNGNVYTGDSGLERAVDRMDSSGMKKKIEKTVSLTPRRVFATAAVGRQQEFVPKQQLFSPTRKKSIVDEEGVGGDDSLKGIEDSVVCATPSRKMSTGVINTTPRKGGIGGRRGRVSVRELEALKISDKSMGSEVILTPVRATRKQQKELGTKSVLTPVRRSRRNSVKRPTSSSPKTTATMLEDTGYAFTPNRNIRKSRGEEDDADNES